MTNKDLPLGEIVLRKYEKPYDGNEREIIKKISLSLGLLQPGDSRDIIIELLRVLITNQRTKKVMSSEELCKEVIKLRETEGLMMRGIAESNIRRQLKRLQDMMIIDKKDNTYHLSEHETLKEIFANKYERFLIPQTIERIKEYLEKI
ncbi:hypothetical protein COU61_04965 [Candidatus Pacearchaeota archaeon CG10_big_fil_rev_8_21_14_0_10_35_13]|nr:MAG: hypothetical protein COU61_04965 [Candidatus Pacearchaeota archaeon CG10_big_fil_rev_8_21_14_0_10_35_13]